MKKLFSLLFFISIFFSISKLNVDAHVLEKDGSVGAIIHIDPDDDPIIGKKSSINFEFKDTNNEFSLEKCSCYVSIMTQGKVIAKERLLPIKELSSHLTYIFPEKGVYTLVIEGNPSQRDSFQEFSFTYDIRVAREATITEKTFPFEIILVIITSVVLLWMIVSLMKKKLLKRGGDKK